MPGIDILIPGSDAGLSSLPFADDNDGILTPGSLVLIDFAHPVLPLVGVPNNGALIENFAWPYLTSLIAGTQDQSRLYFLDNGLAADRIKERSGKGGLHGIYSQVTNTNSNRGMWIASSFAGGPTRILGTYLAANPNNDYYVSIWGRITRVATGALPPLSSAYSNAVNQNNNRLYRMENTGNFDATLGATTSPGFNTLGNFRRTLGTPGWTGTPPTDGTPAQILLPGLMWGNAAAWSGSTNSAASWIAYRYYLEDLTVSGRTFAQVDEIDALLYASAFGTGGRYASDTFTAVSALP